MNARAPSICAGLGLVLLVGLAGRAAVAAVPASAQAATFDKIFGYDRALGERAALRVLIVGPAPPDLRQAFAAAGITAEPVDAAAVAGRLGPSVVAYLSAEAATPALLEQLASAKVLTISGDAALADAGRVAVALEEAGGRTQIVVNLDRLAAEGHDFPAQMLKLARVVRSLPPAAAGAVFQPPVLVSFTKPEYPEVARRLRVEGDVVLRLRVDESGKVVDVELVKGVSRTSGIDDAAIRAASAARFRPATQDGRRVPSVYLLTLPFRL